jgi:hypothetical protein
VSGLFLTKFRVSIAFAAQKEKRVTIHMRLSADVGPWFSICRDPQDGIIAVSATVG